MHNIFIRVTDNNHLECVNYLISLGGKVHESWKDAEELADDCSDFECFGIETECAENIIRWFDNPPPNYEEVFLPKTNPEIRSIELLLKSGWVVREWAWKNQCGASTIILKMCGFGSFATFELFDCDEGKLNAVLKENAQ